MTLSSTKSSQGFSEWLQQMVSEYNQLSDEHRNAVLDAVISASGPSQLFALSQKLPDLVFRDFISYLPLEIVIGILQYLDGKHLLVCCQVCRSWNNIINSLTGLWSNLAQNAGADVTSVENAWCVGNPENADFKCDSDGQIAKSCKGEIYKSLYLHTLVTLRDFSTGTSIHIQEEFIDKGAFRITFVGYHNNRVVTGCDDHTVQMWAIPSGCVVNSIATHSVCCLTLTDRHLYTASFNANAESWDLCSRRHVETFCGHTSAVLAIDVTRDETFLLTGSVDKTAKLWDLRTSPAVLVKTFTVHQDWVFQVKFLPADTNGLQFLTCDSNLCLMWQVTNNGDIIRSYHITSDAPAKFTSFYHVPFDPYQMFTCQWEERTKSSSLSKYAITPGSCVIEQTFHLQIPLVAVKAYLLGAGQKFAVIMCSISRKDFHVIDIPRKLVAATIATPDFCMLTRNGSTVTLCDTRWLDGFSFTTMTNNTPVFAASVGRNTVVLGTWAPHVAMCSWMSGTDEYLKSDRFRGEREEKLEQNGKCVNEKDSDKDCDEKEICIECQ